jgi:hypothetical protein
MKATKSILMVMTALLFNVIAGSILADAAALDPLLVIGAGSALSLLVKPLAGVLPMAINISTVYAGEVLDQLLVRATTGNEIVSGGHLHVQPGVQKRFVIPRLRVGNMLQKRKEQPTEEDSAGDFTIDEKVLEPKDFMAFTTFNPRAFEQIWRPFQPTGNLVFRELPAEVQNQLLGELAKVVDFQLGGEFINGEYSEAEGDFFAGILSRITADVAVISIADAAAIVDANVLAALKSVVAKIPKAMKAANVKKNVKLFMSTEDAEIYDYVLTEKPYKGTDYTNMNPERFKGFQIVPLADWPKDVIVAAYATSGIDSNFWAGVDFVDDADVVQIDKLTNAGEKYFFKMLMKADTNIVFGEDIVLYDARVVVP